MRRAFGVVVSVATATAFFACGSGDDSSVTPGGTDDGGASGNEASTNGDGASPTDAAPTDGGTPSEAGKVDAGLVHTGLVTCDSPFRVDTAGSAQHGVAVVASGTKALVGWKNATDLLVRPIDGTTLGTIADQGADVNPGPLLVADATGRVAVQWMSNTVSGSRAIWSFSSSSFGTTSTFTASAGGDTYDWLASTSSGALSVYPVFNSGVGGEQSTSGGWTSSGVSGAGTSNVAYGLRAASAFGAAPRAVIYWAYETGMLTLHVVTSPGTTSWTEAKRTISPSIPYAGNFAVAVYSNGDPFVAWDDKNHHLMGARYRVATSLWDADQTIDTYAATPDAAGAKASLAIDGSDHLTVAWTYFSNAGAAYHTAYRRDPGSGLGTHEELPGSSFASLVVDHVGTTYLLTREAIADAGANHVVVRRAGTSEATFGPAGDTGIVCPPDTPGSTPSPSAVSFDDDNEPIVVGLDANPSLSPANGVSATRCH